jgi:hypothetical protein
MRLRGAAAIRDGMKKRRNLALASWQGWGSTPLLPGPAPAIRAAGAPAASTGWYQVEAAGSLSDVGTFFARRLPASAETERRCKSLCGNGISIPASFNAEFTDW